MEKEQIKNMVYSIAGKLFSETIEEQEEIADFTARFRMTSIDVLEFLLSIETEFNFEFEDDYLNEKTLKDANVLLDYVQGRITE